MKKVFGSLIRPVTLHASLNVFGQTLFRNPRYFLGFCGGVLPENYQTIYSADNMLYNHIRNIFVHGHLMEVFYKWNFDKRTIFHFLHRTSFESRFIHIISNRIPSKPVWQKDLTHRIISVKTMALYI